MASKRLKKKRLKKLPRCPLCGMVLPQDPTQWVRGSTGQGVCRSCVDVAQQILASKRPKGKQTVFAANTPVKTPEELLRELDRTIIGQERAKQAVAVALWKQQLRARGVKVPGSGLMLYGPTGCGKTALVREAARAAGLPFLSFDATSITEAGYRGKDAADMVSDLVERCGKENAEHGVIFLDEVDKLAALKTNAYRGDYCRGTQFSLLKLIEGMEVNVHGETISTAGILFLFGGAFSGLRKERKEQANKTYIGFERELPEEPELDELTPMDFVDYGMEPELMGRISRCVPLFPLTEADLRRILLESELSVLKGYQAFFKERGQALALEEETLEEIISQAMERGMGARGLNALVEEWVEPRLVELAEGCHG